MSGRYESKKPQNQSTGGWKKTVLIVVLVIVVLIAALVVAGVVYYNSMLNKMNQVQVPTISRTEPTTEPVETTAATEATAATVETTAATEPHVASSADYINILLVGQAAREGEAERFADTMILCTVNTYEKNRDADLTAPGYAGSVSQLYGYQRKEAQRRQDQSLPASTTTATSAPTARRMPWA